MPMVTVRILLSNYFKIYLNPDIDGIQATLQRERVTSTQLPNILWRAYEVKGFYIHSIASDCLHTSYLHIQTLILNMQWQLKQHDICYRVPFRHTLPFCKSSCTDRKWMCVILCTIRVCRRSIVTCTLSKKMESLSGEWLLWYPYNFFLLFIILYCYSMWSRILFCMELWTV